MVHGAEQQAEACVRADVLPGGAGAHEGVLQGGAGVRAQELQGGAGPFEEEQHGEAGVRAAGQQGGGEGCEAEAHDGSGTHAEGQSGQCCVRRSTERRSSVNQYHTSTCVCATPAAAPFGFATYRQTPAFPCTLTPRSPLSAACRAWWPPTVFWRRCAASASASLRSA